MAKELKGQATAAQIADWKKEYNDIFKIEVGESVCYLRKPDRKIMKYHTSIAGDPIRANEVLLDNCWLGGDEAIKTEDSMFYGVSAKLQEIIDIKDSEITKL